MLTRLLLMFFLAGTASAQTVSLQLLTDATIPAAFGSSYPLGQTRTDGYVYGSSFLIGLSYNLPVSSSLTITVSGTQANYLLAWTVATSGVDNAFSGALGSPVAGAVGTQSNVYYRNDGTIQTLAANATRYKIGARATADAIQDLSTPVTITVTSN